MMYPTADEIKVADKHQLNEWFRFLLPPNCHYQKIIFKRIIKRRDLLNKPRNGIAATIKALKSER